jgi:actin
MFESVRCDRIANQMADGEDIQPLVCDNGTGMVKV